MAGAGGRRGPGAERAPGRVELNPGCLPCHDCECGVSKHAGRPSVLIVAIAWMYVVLMMAAAEAVSPQGGVLGAVFTVLLYGVLPLSVVLYVMGTPRRRRARRAAERASAGEPASVASPDGGRHAAGDAVAAEREET